MNNKRFGCLALGLFFLLCISAFINLVLLGATSRGSHSSRKHGSAPRFDERVVVSGSAASSDKIALISLRGLISSSVSGSLGENMVEDIKIALQQAIDDDDVRAVSYTHLTLPTNREV